MANQVGTNDLPPPDHNSPPIGLSDDDREALLLRHLQVARKDNADLEKAMEGVRAVRKRRNGNRNICSNDGFPLKHLDEILSDEVRARSETARDAEIRTRMRRIARQPVLGDDDDQLDLFVVQTKTGEQSLNKDDATWAGMGYAVGLRGEPGDPVGAGVPAEFGNAWMQGWEAGQAKLADGLDRAKKIEKRRQKEAA